MDLGPHSVFIWASYGVTAAVIGALVYRAISDERKQRQALAKLEAKGIRRRSETSRDGGFGA